MKPYMQPWSRNDTLNGTQSGNKLTGTIKKQPMRRNLYASTTKKTPGRQTEACADFTVGPLVNNTFSILNCSTSTEIDRPITRSLIEVSPKPSNLTLPSFSPFVRKIDEILDKKLASFMKNLENQTNLTLQTQNDLRKDMMRECFGSTTRFINHDNGDSNLVRFHIDRLNFFKNSLIFLD